MKRSGRVVLTSAILFGAMELAAQGASFTAVSRGQASDTASSEALVSEMSPDGRYVVVSSQATPPIAGVSDSNGHADLVLFDRVAASGVLISRSLGSATSSAAAATDARAMAISDDGRFTLWQSDADNVVGADSNGLADVFVFDRDSGTNQRVSHAAGAAAMSLSAASEAVGLSADGRFVLFSTQASGVVAAQAGVGSLFLYDRDTGLAALVSHNLSSQTTSVSAPATGVAISADGAYVLWQTAATDVGPGLQAPAQTQVYLYERAGGNNQLVSRSKIDPNLGSNDAAEAVGLSGDGRYVVFNSYATDLINGLTDGNGQRDAFLFDRQSGSNQLVSASSASASVTAAGTSLARLISRDGRYLALRSQANNLVASQLDANGDGDVFLFDRQANFMRLVSRVVGSTANTPNAGGDPAAISADGAFLLWTASASNLDAAISDGNGASDVYRYALSGDVNRLVSARAGLSSQTGNAAANAVAISNDGRYAAFHALASDLVAGVRDANARNDAFLWDGDGPVTQLVSTAAAPVPAMAGAIGLHDASDDLRFVLWPTQATGVLAGVLDDNSASDLYLHDRVADTQVLVTRSAAVATEVADAGASFGQISGDGAWVAFVSASTDLVSGHSNLIGQDNVYLYKRASGQITLVSHAAGAPTQAGNAASADVRISGDGRYVLYASVATDLVAGFSDSNGSNDVFLYDRVDGDVLPLSFNASAPTSLVGGANVSDLSADGSVAAWTSTSFQVVVGSDSNGKSDVFLYSTASGSNALVSRRQGLATPTTGNSDSGFDALSPDGRYLLWNTRASNLGPADSNGTQGVDLYRFDRLAVDPAQSSTLVSHALGVNSTTASGRSLAGSLSDDGAWVAFCSNAQDLVAASDTSNSFDGFLWRASTNTVTLISHRNGDPGTAVGGCPSSISADGSRVAWTGVDANIVPGISGTAGNQHLYLHFPAADQHLLVSHGAADPFVAAIGASFRAELSDDGSRALLTTNAENLIAGVIDANGNDDRYLALLPSSLPEPSSTAIVGDTPDPSLVGQSVLVSVQVSGATTAPVSGRVTVSASSGESCVDDTPLAVDADTAAFSCSIGFNDPAGRTLSAAFSRSIGHAASATGSAEAHAVLATDFGDAPASYGSTAAANGPRHGISGSVFLGLTGPDAETDAATPLDALGDDGTASDDEDGLVSATLVRGTNSSISVRASGVGLLNAFADWNRDGDFDLPEEVIATDVITAAGVQVLAVAVPANASIGASVVRLRLSTAGGLSPLGFAMDGEVEDHGILISGQSPTIAVIEAQERFEDQPGAALAISIGDPDSDVAALVLSATSDNQSLITDAALAAGLGGSGANRTLSLNTQANANSSAVGGATISVQVADPEGNGASRTFAFTVHAVNDAPTFDGFGPLEYPTGSSGARSELVAQASSFGPTDDEQAQGVLEFTMTSNDPAGVLSAASLGNDGLLDFTLSGASGTASLELRLRDDGGIANGGVDLSAPQTLEITVLPGHDAEVAVDNGLNEVRPGQALLYQIDVGNGGGAEVSGVAVSTSATGLANLAWTCVALVDASCDEASGTGAINGNVNLLSGGQVRFELLADVPAGFVGNVVLSASITPPNGSVDENPDNNSAEDADPVAPEVLFGNGFEQVNRRLSF